MRAIKGDFVASLENPAIHGSDLTLYQIEAHRRRTHHAGQPQAAPDYGGVTGDTATFSQDRLGGMHTANIFGGGFAPHKYALFPAGRAGLRVIGVEHDLTRRRPWACRDTPSDHVALGPWVNLPVQ